MIKMSALFFRVNDFKHQNVLKSSGKYIDKNLYFSDDGKRKF